MTGRSKSYPNDHLSDSWADTSTCGRHPPKQRSKCSCYLIFSIIVWRVQGSMPTFEKLWRIRFQSTNNSVVNFRLKIDFRNMNKKLYKFCFLSWCTFAPFKIWQSTGKCFHICCSFCHFRSSTSRSLEGSFLAPEISRLFGDTVGLPLSVAIQSPNVIDTIAKRWQSEKSSPSHA